MTSIWCELALVDGQPRPGVLLEVSAGRIASIRVDAEPGAASRLAGLTIPGLANAHSHAFHRALRSRAQVDRGTFWTWRDLMYRAAGRLDPDAYHRLARAVFAEMALAGVTCVGEFHYLHHGSDGAPYTAPNAMGDALLAAADDAGIRITLLDTLYLHGGLGADGYRSPEGVQQRFCDRDVDAWIERVASLRSSDTHRIGAAVHSIRAVDPAAIRVVADFATTADLAVHAHVSEQVGENDACLAHHGARPVTVLAANGLLSDRFSAVHATHVVDVDVDELAAAGSIVVMCPTTERDLGDGIGPTDRFAATEIPMALGTDSHAVIDLFEEARALELDERLRSHRRGVHAARDLLAAATVGGHRSLGWSDAGEIAVGNRADLVTVRLDSPRTAGATVETVLEACVFAAAASDVTDVYVDGRLVVSDGRHVSVDVAGELDASIRQVMDDGR